MPIETDWEKDKARRKERKTTRRRLRRRMVDADRDSRPAVLSRMAFLILNRRWPSVTGYDDDDDVAHDDEAAQRLVERVLLANAWMVWAVFGGFTFWDGLRSGDYPQSYAYAHVWIGALLLAFATTSLVLLMIDIASYRPRLFSVCIGPADEFFEELSHHSMSLRDWVQTIRASSVSTLSEAKDYERTLLAESHQFLLLDGLRTRVTRRVLQRLTSLVGGLAIFGYGLSAVTQGDVVHGLAAGAGLPEHSYFTLVGFLTVGFGDLYPTHRAAGYGFTALVLGTFALVAYFVLTELAASHGEFRSNIRTAAEAMVMEHAQL